MVRDDLICTVCGARFKREHAAKVCWPCADVIRKNIARAGRLVKQAIISGNLAPITADTKCVDCGSPAYCYDHRDYGRPLDVEPVCRSCNNTRGPGIHAIPTRELRPDMFEADK